MITTDMYRLYPTASQARQMNMILHICRNWYNMCLGERKYAYELEAQTISKYEQLRQVKFYKSTIPQAKGVHSHILQIVVSDLDKAFKAFFRRVKTGETAGYPRFKTYHRFHSFGFKEYGNGFKIDGRRLKISGVGRVAVRWHRQLGGAHPSAKIKTCRIIRKAGKWYVAFSVEVPDPMPQPPTGNRVGIDVGISALFTTSNGLKEANPNFYRKSQMKLRRLQRKLARAQRGSFNRRKRLLAVQRQQSHVKHQRQDYINKLAHGLVQHNDIIAVEDLPIKNMVRNHHLSKSILDSGWGYFVQRLSDKAAEAGRLVVLVDPRYTSKTCSNCGKTFADLTLKDRWVDYGCGLSLDRDHNAALNILQGALNGLDESVKPNVVGCHKRASEATPLEWE